MLNSAKIFQDSINGPQNIQLLSVLECFVLLAIHNKKYIESIVECGNAFDLYAADNHISFKRIGEMLEFNDEQTHLVETNNIFSQHCNFLFVAPVVDQKWIHGLIGLYEKGFLNFPPRERDGRSLLDQLQELPSHTIERKTLAEFPVLIACLNKITVGIDCAEKHFHSKTPQYARYSEALMICQNNPKAMKSIHEIYASIIYVDELIAHFHRNIIPLFKKDKDYSVFIEFLEAIRIDPKSDQTERALNESLQSSEINNQLNWLFNAGSLNKHKRVEFLKHLALKDGDPRCVFDYILEKNLLIDCS